jgi:hypothetical protein
VVGAAVDDEAACRLHCTAGQADARDVVSCKLKQDFILIVRLTALSTPALSIISGSLILDETCSEALNNPQTRNGSNNTEVTRNS